MDILDYDPVEYEALDRKSAKNFGRKKKQLGKEEKKS